MDLGPSFDQEYESRCDVLADLGSVSERLIQELLRAKGIEAHSVRHRIKAKESVQRKAGRKDASYKQLTDVHDLLGLRVVTFFPDEVDLVANVLEREFAVDTANSVDKRALLDPDRFGYLSRHYVATLSDKRTRLTELSRFRGFKFEIQIRSILQHAWAEIEHDLGYHSAGAIPDSFRRRFSRLAGLLEIADDEFQTLRNEVTEYQSAVEKEVDKTPESVPIDQDSIAALIKTDAEIGELDQYIAGVLEARLIEDSYLTAGSLATKCKRHGFETIAQVADAVRERSPMIRAFAFHWAQLDDLSVAEAYPGISLFYLAYVLASDSGKFEDALTYLEEESIGEPEERPDTAKKMVEIAEASKRQLGLD